MALGNPFKVTSDMRSFVTEAVETTLALTMSDLGPILGSEAVRHWSSHKDERPVGVTDEELVRRIATRNAVLVASRAVDAGRLGSKFVNVYLAFIDMSSAGRVLSDGRTIIINPLILGFVGIDAMPDSDRQRISSELHSTAIHELVHVFDPRLRSSVPSDALVEASYGAAYARATSEPSVAGYLGRGYFSSEHEFEAFTTQRIEEWLGYLDETPSDEVEETRAAMLLEIRAMASMYERLSRAADKFGDPMADLRGKTFLQKIWSPRVLYRLLRLSTALADAVGSHKVEWLPQDVAWGLDRKLWRKLVKELYRSVSEYRRRSPNPRDWDASALGDWSVTYTGGGVVTNRAGSFSNGTTANVSESLAKTMIRDQHWIVADPNGQLVSERPQSEPAPISSVSASHSRRRPSKRVSVEDYRQALLKSGAGVRLSRSSASALIAAAHERADGCLENMIANGIFCSGGNALLVLPSDKEALQDVERFLWRAAKKRPALRAVACSLSEIASLAP